VSWRLLFALLAAAASTLAFVTVPQFVFDWSGTLFSDDALVILMWAVVKCGTLYIVFVFRTAGRHSQDWRALSVFFYLVLKGAVSFVVFNTKFKTEVSNWVYVDFILNGQFVTVCFFFIFLCVYA